MDGVRTLYPPQPDRNGKLRLSYAENRYILFTSEPFDEGTSQDQRREIFARFLTALAFHQAAEITDQWSPAHVGYTVRTYRETRVLYLMDKADRIDDRATDWFGDNPEAWYVYVNSLK